MPVVRCVWLRQMNVRTVNKISSDNKTVTESTSVSVDAAPFPQNGQHVSNDCSWIPVVKLSLRFSNFNSMLPLVANSDIDLNVRETFTLSLFFAAVVDTGFDGTHWLRLRWDSFTKHVVTFSSDLFVMSDFLQNDFLVIWWLVVNLRIVCHFSLK